MTTLDARTFDAATRVLATAAADPQHYTDAEANYAAWLVGRGDGPVPAFADPVAQRLAEMAAAFGAHRDDDAIALLEAAVADEDRGVTYVMPFIHACYLAGDRIPDRIIDVIQRYPAQASNAVSGELLVRTTYRTRPVRAEYLITPRGRAFWPVLLSIWEWERRWVPDHVDRLPEMHHTLCDNDFAPTLTCRSCGEAVTEKEVAARWGPSGSWPRSVPGMPPSRMPLPPRLACK